MTMHRLSVLLAPGVLLLAATVQAQDVKPLRAGMIGLDTSHVIAFTKVFNNPEAQGELAAVKIVAGYPGGTDIPASRDRVVGFTNQLRDRGIEIVDTIPALLERVDVVLLESVDGRIHLDEARQVIAAKKPLFIDKPIAGSLVDALAILELARRSNVPCFSASSIRFSPTFRDLAQAPENDPPLGAATWGPCSIQAGMPDLFFYGVHGVEGLFTIMGSGCQSVRRVHTADFELVTGVWSDGRVGTYRGLRKGKSQFGAVRFGESAIRHAGPSSGYAPLCEEIAKFFRTGRSPIPVEETIEIFAFMEAADESRKRGGESVSVTQLIEAARTVALEKLK